MSYLLPTYFLEIGDEALTDLRNNLMSNESIPAIFKVENTYYQINLAYRGSYTRKFKKRSYVIEFNHPETFLAARKIHLNAEYKDPSLIRNKLSLDFFEDIGILSPHSQHVNLMRNDTYKGVYLQLESVDDLFLKNRNLPLGPIYYAVNNNANFSSMRDDKPKESLISGYKQVVGKSADDQYLYELIKSINTTPISQFPDKVSQHMDVKKFLLWLAGAVCTMNNDGFTRNYALYRNSETNLFEILPWDYDATWGRKINGKLMNYTYVPIAGKNENALCQVLLQVPEYRKMYKNILEEILETRFTVKYMKNKVLSLHQDLRPHIFFDPYKRKKINLFDNEPNVIFQFITKRNHYLKQQLKTLN